jgi:CRISPR-associated protein Csb2
MLRFATKHSARQAGWPAELINSLILGHAEQHGQPHQPVNGPRLAYLPLPSIQYRGGEKADVVTDIRRAILMQFGGGDTQRFQNLMRLLGGAELIPKPYKDAKSGPELFDCQIEWDQPELKNPHEPTALLSRLPDSDKNVLRYTRRASTWATVTPLLLPGYDDPKHYRRRLGTNGLRSDEQKRLLEKLDARIESLIRSAIEHAGYSHELASHAHIEWRGTGFWPGVDLASRYEVPIKLKKFPRLHVRITWRDSGGNELSLPGPICLGAGRYFGFGLFAGQ